jgi:peptide-methionine (S)-S-oxide reductase
MAKEKATFGAGCFWGVETTFRNVKGVTDAAVGYSGGKTENPTYQDVCSDETGHAEVVQVEFDPTVVSYRQLLEVFWANHNPTTLNRQGPDVGRQYRSVIFYHTPEQRAAAEELKAELEKGGRFRRPIVTQIEPAPAFYRAEEYHQRYLEKRGLSHCAI